MDLVENQKHAQMNALGPLSKGIGFVLSLMVTIFFPPALMRSPNICLYLSALLFIFPALNICLFFSPF